MYHGAKEIVRTDGEFQCYDNAVGGSGCLLCATERWRLILGKFLDDSEMAMMNFRSEATNSCRHKRSKKFRFGLDDV